MSNEEQYDDPLLHCLVLYTKLYGKPMSADAIVYGLPIEEGKSTPVLFSPSNSKSMFSRAAKNAGLESRLVKESVEHISNIVLPAILILRDGKAAILERIDKEKNEAHLVLPHMQELQFVTTLEALKQEYLGYMFLLKKRYKYRLRQKNIIAEKGTHWFWGTVLLSKTIYRDVLIASFIINIFIIASPLFTMNIYDRVVPNSAIETLWVLSIGIFVVYMIDLFLKNIRSYFLEIAAKKSDVIMSSLIFEKVLDMKMSERPTSTGSFANNLRDFDSIRGFLTSTTMTALIDIPFAILFFIIIGFLGGGIVVVPFVVALIILAYVLVIRQPLQTSIQSTYEASSNKNAVLIESLYNLETIKAMGAAGHTQWQWEEATGEIASKSLKSKIISGSIPSIVQFFVHINTLGVLIYGVYQIDAKELTMGALIAIVMLSQRALAPIGQVASLTANYESTKTAYEGIEAIMKKGSEHPQDKEFVQRDALRGEIVFRKLYFKYHEEERWALEDVNFTIREGEKVAIIGRIGSGKTTIEKMILGLYEANEGALYFDGIDIRQLDPANVRQNIAYVAQDITLFSGTLKENIVYKYPQATDEDIIKVAKITGLDEFVNRHPKGFDMPVGERGEGLSGGQRQSIAIARALVMDAPILLLDEPTNMMDTTTENRFIHNLKNALGEKTTIIVTHKTSLLQLVDRIIVMDNGRVVMDGDKASILKQLKGGM
ncbi:MAG: ABC transporter [Sulfuricurvum sp. PC08-66]|nr:MAG: ABC transporter [Sulfuricurvum sp. PC08-66]